MGDHEAGLPLLPGKTDQRRAENVGRQKGQQDGEPGALIDQFLGGLVPYLDSNQVANASEAASELRLNTASLSDARNR